MGKSLIIKGADFSQNGIPVPHPLIDITTTVLATLYNKSSTDTGLGPDATNRATTPVMAISSFGGAIGDKLKIECPQGYYVGIRHGTGSTSVPNNVYWYAKSNSPSITAEMGPWLGEQHTISNNYCLFSWGKSASTYQSWANIPVSEIQSLISNGQIKIYLEKYNV